MKKTIRTLAAAFSMLAGFATITGAVVIAGGTSSPVLFDKAGNAVPHSESAFSVNNNGQTYGTAGDKMYDEDLPDLISVIGDHGVHGYVTKDDFFG